MEVIPNSELFQGNSIHLNTYLIQFSKLYIQPETQAIFYTIGIIILHDTRVYLLKKFPGWSICLFLILLTLSPFKVLLGFLRVEKLNFSGIFGVLSSFGLLKLDYGCVI